MAELSLTVRNGVVIRDSVLAGSSLLCIYWSILCSGLYHIMLRRIVLAFCLGTLNAINTSCPLHAMLRPV